ncbi:DUF1289 domain-containing protein [Hoeflea sp. AS60]|uniref:DUF1289 domain-containing protein n=1 Tax=Hoeflea sp. AS60 TaxID=3135780 RepID=UPI00316DC1BE
MMKNDSPCADLCRFDPRNKWCAGCGRTMDEIKAWRKMSPYHRTNLLTELKRRMKRLKNS